MAEERLEPVFTRKDLHIPTLAEAREILGGRLPSVFEKYDFPEPGIILTEKGPRVTVYPASNKGFDFPGRFFLDNYLHPKIEEIGGFVLDPFEMCGELIDPSLFDFNRPLIELIRGWNKFNYDVVDTVNYSLAFPRTAIVFALYEGVPVDDGMSSEMAYFATNFAAVIGVRSDFRLGENVATGTNPAVRVFADPKYGGQYFEDSRGDNAYVAGLDATKKIVDQRLAKWEQSQKTI